jgi:3-deoxy-7-phosphoheptulonate synthase
VDPSHSVGKPFIATDGLQDLFHATGQGIISGANMVLVDFHPDPTNALCDGPQALKMEQLDPFLQYCSKVRKAYEECLDIGCGLIPKL